MLPSSNKGPSLNFGFPDVCLTPVGPVIVPIPYPNFGAHAAAVAFSPIVSTAMIPALNLGSVIAVTTGDEPGVAHWTVKGPGAFDMGNPVVFVDMLPGINLTCPTDGNTGNDEPGMVVAPGAPNVLYTLAPADGDRAERAMDPGDLRAMEELLEEAPIRGERMAAEGIGVISIRVFSWRLPAAFDLAFSRLSRGGMRGLVIDLRGCPGGELTAMLEVCGDFLERGQEIVTMADAEGDRVCHRARRERAYRVPVVLVVDGDTASAAELFAAALAAHGRAGIVGSPTHGKSTGQVVIRDGAGRAVAVTAARFSPPETGREVRDGEGRVVPDIGVGDGDGDGDGNGNGNGDGNESSGTGHGHGRAGLGLEAAICHLQALLRAPETC